MVYSAIANLEHALRIAETYRGFCAPNPAVGAVVLKEGRWLASGVHRGAGQVHAEVEALQKIDDARGATLLVTLEPCCHFGKTPPCTNFIAERGVSHVVYGYQDPNPKVCGQGAKQLVSLGITTTYLPLPSIAASYQSYAHWITYRRPHVTAKLALTLDGKIAAGDRSPVAITGEALKTLTYEYRRSSDAILTTVRTVLNDDPQLNVRNRDPSIAKPIYVLDKNLDFPLNARIWTTAASLIVLHGPNVDTARHRVLTERGATLIAVPLNDEEQIDLNMALDVIGQQGIHALWVEAGGTLVSALIKAHLLQAMLLYVAPNTLGETALSAFHLPQLFEHATKVTWDVFQRESVCRIEF